MNFLVHLWLTERAGLPLAGAVLGDVLRGRIETLQLPAAMAASVVLHRRVDAAADRLEAISRLRSEFPSGARRYAGPVLDIVSDHLLARDWPRFHQRSLANFADYAAAQVAAEAARFAAAGVPTPTAAAFAAWLTGYADPAGIERALARMAARARDASSARAAGANWQWASRQLAPQFSNVVAALADVR